MARNIEIKARIPHLATIRTKAAALASGPIETIDQTDTFFAVPRGRLKVRTFSDGSGELITYERADQEGPKESVYMRVACEDARALSQALGNVLLIRGIVRKRRELFLLGRTRVHLDRVDDLGCFVELEVVLSPGESIEDGQSEAHRLLRALEIPGGALVAESYIDLLSSSATTSHGILTVDPGAEIAGGIDIERVAES